MKPLLKRIPIETDLMRLYWELSQIGAPSIGKNIKWPYQIKSKEQLIILACEMLRFDPRLLTILIVYFIQHWSDLNPVIFRQWYDGMKHPQVVGVLREFIIAHIKDSELKFFLDYLVKGLKSVEPQLFFTGLYQIGGMRDKLASQQSLREYRRWGFLGIERPIVKIESKKTIGTYDIQTRKNIIRNLIQKNGATSLKDYLDSIDHTISRQQALYDLKHCKEIRLKGRGRGAKWTKR